MQIRIMTYNICEGAAGREEALLNVVRAANPDLLLMQELLNRQNGQYFVEQLGMKEVSFCFADSNARTRNLMLLSRYPIVACEAFHPFPLFRTLLLATIRLPDGQLMNLFGLHLALIHDLWRVYELRKILAKIERYQANHPASFSLIAGDFNSVAAADRVTYQGVPLYYKIALALLFTRFPRFAVSMVKNAGYLDCFRACHPYLDGFTMPTTSPNVRLDYIFANSALAACLIECQIMTEPVNQAKEASDHYPLIADFLLTSTT